MHLHPELDTGHDPKSFTPPLYPHTTLTYFIHLSYSQNPNSPHPPIILTRHSCLTSPVGVKPFFYWASPPSGLTHSRHTPSPWTALRMTTWTYHHKLARKKRRQTCLRRYSNQRSKHSGAPRTRGRDYNPSCHDSSRLPALLVPLQNVIKLSLEVTISKSVNLSHLPPSLLMDPSSSSSTILLDTTSNSPLSHKHQVYGRNWWHGRWLF